MKQVDASIVAVLAIIGGADNRVRLGGAVENQDHGKGIVTRITKSGKICVQSCEDDQVIKNSPLSLWRVVRNHFNQQSLVTFITNIITTKIVGMFAILFQSMHS